MFSNETTQRMVERRSELLREASEARDVDKLIDSYSEDATFRNVCTLSRTALTLSNEI